MEIPPRVLALGALWVIVADGIFAGMAYAATGAASGPAVAVGVLLMLALYWISVSRPWRLVMSLAAGVVFGALIYSMSALIGFALVVGLQLSLMHSCAFMILALPARVRVKRMQQWLRSRRARSARG